MSKVQIVILQRGWVYVGEYSEEGDYGKLSKCKNIRRWGTTQGLGEIALNGPKENTILDNNTDVRFHKLTVIAQMDVVDEKWADVIK